MFAREAKATDSLTKSVGAFVTSAFLTAWGHNPVDPLPSSPMLSSDTAREVQRDYMIQQALRRLCEL